MKITTVPQNCGPSLLVINDILFGVTGKLIRFFLGETILLSNTDGYITS